MDCSPPDFSVHGILQARILEWIAISFSRGSSWPRDRTQVSRITSGFFTIWAIGKSLLLIYVCITESFCYACETSTTLYINYMCVLVSQSCPTICDPIDCSLPGSSIHGISQARILEWVAIPLSRVSSQPRDWTQVSWIAGRFFIIWATREITFQY